MVIGVVEKADTLVLDHNERLDSWAVVLNGHVECTLPDGSIKAYHIGDQYVHLFFNFIKLLKMTKTIIYV